MQLKKTLNFQAPPFFVSGQRCSQLRIGHGNLSFHTLLQISKDYLCSAVCGGRMTDVTGTHIADAFRVSCQRCTWQNWLWLLCGWLGKNTLRAACRTGNLFVGCHLVNMLQPLLYVKLVIFNTIPLKSRNKPCFCWCCSKISLGMLPWRDSSWRHQKNTRKRYHERTYLPSISQA